MGSPLSPWPSRASSSQYETRRLPGCCTVAGRGRPAQLRGQAPGPPLQGWGRGSREKALRTTATESDSEVDSASPSLPRV